jgi:chaperone required for assembly of F1-ATPase
MIRRFYSDVTLAPVAGGFQVMLAAPGGRTMGVKTVGGAAQIVPTQLLGEALAAEWRAQGETIDPASLPMRDVADYAIDIVAADPASIARGLIAYAETDTLCYRADPDAPLYARQLAVWEPLLAGFEAAHGVTLTRVSGVLHRPQPPATLAKLEALVRALNPFVLAGVEAMTTLAASLVVALTALEARPNPLWEAVSLEERWQAEQWGHDAEAEARSARREADFLRACAFARLARS